MLTNKNAVIYGAGGAVGGAIARAFAREGARVFLTGRNLSKVDAVAKEITAAGGKDESAQVNALDEQAVNQHLQSVIDKAACVDISFNAVGIPNATLQGVPLVELAAEQFSLPIATYTRSYFLTARLAARRMVEKRSGVIMTVTSVPSRTGIPLTGGVGPAMSAVEASLGFYPPSSHLTAFALWVCDQTGCPSRARSRKSSGFTLGHGDFRGNSFTK